MSKKSLRSIKGHDKFSRHEINCIKKEVEGFKCGFFQRRNFSATFKMIKGVYHVNLVYNDGCEKFGKFVLIMDTKNDN